jgi:hypothetical protein
LADRTVLYFRGFACKAASVVISGSIREGKGREAPMTALKPNCEHHLTQSPQPYTTILYFIWFCVYREAKRTTIPAYKRKAVSVAPEMWPKFW